MFHWGRRSGALDVIVRRRGQPATRTAHADARTAASLSQSDPSAACCRRDRVPTDRAGDLHRHLEGSIRPETSLELATRIGAGLLPAQRRSAFVAAEREEGLLPYLAKIENATALVRTLDDWRRVTAEAVNDAVSTSPGGGRS